MEARAKEAGFRSLSDYLRVLVRRDLEASPKKQSHPRLGKPLTKFHTTKFGAMWNGDSLDWLTQAKPGSVDLVMTSPPFGLLRKKSYGNEDAHAYCDWFRPFAEGFKRVLKDNGSLVIDIGGAWKTGLPTRSLYHFELLIMLCEEYGFHLCQEHYWWNPAKLPTPAEWVNVRRVRVKDAVNCIWWLSPTPWPKASNRRILAPYSESMKHLLKNGYQAKTRPSGHVISEKFGKDNGGSVPPNLLAIANTESNGQYQEFCNANNLDVHPARFPALLPEYFIRMLTDPGDMVLDPFGGSCVTGMVAETLERRWACVELNMDYLNGAVARFEGDLKGQTKMRLAPYSIHAPCAVPVLDEEAPLAQDGGKARPPTTQAA
ncbi:DNA-methyltransferase [Ralstonia pickettii]|uniref:DNA-methyltransferase n=2 Tax=Burkholderiaceae TaxID=119060 RepID=UPI0005017C03|nr:site-specific DNA-methyltransferase [Ralstonia pickettii]KFL24355.1 modification methylase PvuII domain protein [Ralstonia pickettii]